MYCLHFFLSYLIHLLNFKFLYYTTLVLPFHYKQNKSLFLEVIFYFVLFNTKLVIYDNFSYFGKIKIHISLIFFNDDRI